MKIVAKIFTLAFLATAIALTGCSKKPKRPSPDQTMMGPNGGGSINPLDVNTVADANSGLEQRPEGVIEDEFTIRGLLQPVYFDYDKSGIKQSERTKLEAAAEYLKAHPEHRLLLEGYCDWRGTAEYNSSLGDRRANAAKKFLLSLGVATTKLESNSKGSLEAIKSGTEEQMSKDRRAEVVILKK